jgi:hypothetical protein
MVPLEIPSSWPTSVRKASCLFKWPLVGLFSHLSSQSVCRGFAGMDAEEAAALAAGEDTQVYGTFEYMSPECYHRNYGQPCFASDVFSFALVVWELLVQRRIYTAMATIDPELHYTEDAQGNKSTDVELVARRFAEDDERPAIRAGECPVVLEELIRACWVGDVQMRPTFAQMKQCLPLDDWAADGGSAVAAEPEPESIPGLDAGPFGGWLAALSIQDKKAELDEWDVKEDKDPLCKLVEMLKEEAEDGSEDLQEMIEDLFDGDEAMQGKFRAAVVVLAEPEQGNTAWRKLCGLWGVKDGDVLEAGKAEDKRLLRLRADLDEEKMHTVEEVLAEKDAELAARDSELAKLRAQLA